MKICVSSKFWICAISKRSERSKFPHHAVEDRSQILVDASEKTSNGESLNSIQMIGSKLQCDLQLQIMRF